MTHPPASRNYSEQQAGSLRAGDHLILPDGNRSAEIHRVDVETDDFGTPAMVLATLSGGGVLRIAAGSLVRVTDDAEPGTPASDGGAPGTPTPSAAAPEPRRGAANRRPARPARRRGRPGTTGADAIGSDAPSPTTRRPPPSSFLPSPLRRPR